MDQKYEEKDLKFEETRLTNWDLKGGNGSKIWVNGPKFEETDQQIKILKFLKKSGNRSKIWGNGSKMRGNRSILKFFKSRKG